MSKKVCRLCLQIVDGAKYYDVNTVEAMSGFMPFRDQLTTCMPEVALDFIPESILCSTCAASLRAAYDFKIKCLETEEQIKRHFDNKTNTDYDLTELAREPPPATIIRRRQYCRVQKILHPIESVDVEPSNRSIKKQMKTEPIDELDDDDGFDDRPLAALDFNSPTTCEECSEVFDDEGKLKDHRLTHIQRSHYACNFCNQEFTTLNTLRRHNSTCSQSGKPEVPEVVQKRPHLPLKAKNQLTQWLFSHQHHPYPTDYEKQYLMKQTNLTLLQVENWFINARRRVLIDYHKRRKYQRVRRVKTEVVDAGTA